MADIATVSAVVVSTTNGRVRGHTHTFMHKQVQVFLGVPYAKPPIGELRFQKPQSPESWDDIYDANSDCLYLNAWTPNATQEANLPVLVWFYGEVFKMDSAYETRYNATALSALNDVVVSCNFRLSIFGYLDVETTPGNVGLWDQLFVLRWELENHPEVVLECLQGRSAAEVSEASENVTAPKVLAFVPTFGTEFLPRLPSVSIAEGRFRPVDAMVSVTANEGAFAYVMQPDTELLWGDLSDYDREELKNTLYDNILSSWLKDSVLPLAIVYLEQHSPGDNAEIRQAVADVIGNHYFYCPSRFFAELHTAQGGNELLRCRLPRLFTTGVVIEAL
ncbi:hypothetical protein HPB52_020174 [Rhipicephalus sanguineus]|uniref:Carboxylesterase type B domain-containing protein n=1 Tax=Rhipicephalus sanguineus TaxID=34632 RepID=A0A9D4PTF6_RHISA|nr:hypothetical protein HPB52_020174 [Rhipicephalus sanguineus]